MNIGDFDTSFKSIASVGGALLPKLGDKGTAAGETLNQFGNLLSQEMNKISELDAEAKSNVEDYATGGTKPLHQVIMSIEKSDMALQVATQVRNKMLAAYQEVSRMQI